MAEPSYVLKALKVESIYSMGAVRIGLGRFTTNEQINYLIKILTEEVEKLRGIN